MDVIEVINREIAEYATGEWITCANGDCGELISRLHHADDEDDEIDGDEMHFCVDCTLELVEHRCVHCWEQELIHLPSCSRCRGCGKVMLSGCSCGVCLDDGCEGRFCIDCHPTTACVACHRYVCRLHLDNALELEEEDETDDDETYKTTDDDDDDYHAFVTQNETQIYYAFSELDDSSNIYVCRQCGSQ